MALLFLNPQKRLEQTIEQMGLKPDHNYLQGHYRVRNGLQVFQSDRYRHVSPDTGKPEHGQLLIFTPQVLYIHDLSRNGGTREVAKATATNFGVIPDVEGELVLDFKVDGLANSFSLLRGNYKPTHFLAENFIALQENHFFGWQR